MGPLEGLKVIELAGLGPAPFCGMLLGDMGADVLCVDRIDVTETGVEFSRKFDLRNRNKRSALIDIKQAEGQAVLLELIAKADILIEGFRPGVTERLGIGPSECLARNPRLVYGRATGWGQDGPLAHSAGHDINYIALTGALDCIGPADGAPVPPLNLVGDYGGGALYLAFGIMCAVVEARQSGKGQVIDAAMIDGVSSLLTVFHAFRQMGALRQQRGANLLDGGAPFYRCYETKDRRYIAVGAIEERFYDSVIERIGLKLSDLPDRNDRLNWPELRQRFENVFRTRTLVEWARLLEGTDACCSPVLSLEDAIRHSHNRQRSLLVEVDGVAQPQPTPRLSRTPGGLFRAPPEPGQHTREALESWGLNDFIVDSAFRAGAVAESSRRREVGSSPSYRR
jgi:alpha-methylacyl-CoA racemase